MPPSDDIKTYRAQLEDFLSRKYADQAMLLGFNVSVQAKFYSWIIPDFDRYQKSLESECTTINYFDEIWTGFHYPIIKFLQQQHASVFDEQNENLKTCQKEGRPGEFKVRPVEMRKINDNFMKFIKEVYQFYAKLLRYFATRFKNYNVPRKFLEHFNFVVPSDAVDCKDDNFLGNDVQLIHKCCLCLGDMLRHQAFIETNFVVPCTSNKEFFKFKSSPDKKNQLGAYAKAIQYYNLCIMLVPALSEPYNHIGVIHNSVDDKFTAIYWFLRSHFTRVSEHKLGFTNMTAILNKHWFTTALVDIVNGNAERHFSKTAEMNVYLVCLIGYIYCPERYKSGPNIVKKIPFSKIETDLFKSVGVAFDEQVVLKHLVVLFSFIRLTNGEQREKLLRFGFRYVEKILVCLKSHDSLIVLRFILNLLRENSEWLSVFTSRRNCVVYLAAVLNNYVGVDTTTRPVRDFFFWEDVHFRDCSLIKYQFKDFNDDAIFGPPYNVNVMVGDVAGDEEYVRSKRATAVMVLGLKILGSAKDFDLVRDEQTKKITMKKKQKETRVTVPTTMHDIESLIAKQNKQLSMDIDNHQGLQSMVDKLVGDDDDDAPQPGIWQNEQPRHATPDFLNQPEIPSAHRSAPPQSRDYFTHYSQYQ